MKKLLNVRVLAPAGLLIASIWWLCQAYKLGSNVEEIMYDKGYFPRIVLWYMTIALVYVVVSEVVATLKGPEPAPANKESLEMTIKMIIEIIVAIVYTFVLKKIGFIVATILLLAISLINFCNKKVITIASVSVIFTLVIYLIFTYLLKVSLP